MLHYLNEDEHIIDKGEAEMMLEAKLRQLGNQNPAGTSHTSIERITNATEHPAGHDVEPYQRFTREAIASMTEQTTQNLAATDFTEVDEMIAYARDTMVDKDSATDVFTVKDLVTVASLVMPKEARRELSNHIDTGVTIPTEYTEGSIQGIINKNEPYVTAQVTGYAAQQRKQDSENLSLDLGGLTEDSATL